MDKQEIWDKACVLMRDEMAELNFNTWIGRGLQPLGRSGDTFYVKANSLMYQQYIAPRYSALIADCLSRAAGEPLKLEILNQQQAEEFQEGESVARQTADEASLNPRYTFDSFVVGNNNSFAQAAALAVAETPGEAYNPLFIYGGVGLGKTHLMHAVGHYVLSQNKDARVRYVTTEVFTNEMITAINTRTMTEFRNRYRNIDVLLVDDIQFLAGREGTQEEFFHTFNALHTSGKQVIISSDKPPKEIPKLEERLRSRFEWGLIADIAKPDEETRYEILRRKAEASHMEVDGAILHMIAEHVSSNIRELEGCLTRVSAYASLTKRPIDMQLAEEALREVFSANEPRHVTCEDIMRMVAEYYNVDVNELKGNRRNREISVPRQIAMYLSREMVDLSLEMIGNAFGRDHSTVMHACQKVATESKTSPSLATVLDDLKKQLTER